MAFVLVAILMACSFFVALPAVQADAVPPDRAITLLDQDLTSQPIIPPNIVHVNNQQTTTTTTMVYNNAAKAIEHKKVGDQGGLMLVGIEPFINGNLSFNVRVNSDSWYSSVNIQGSTFWVITQTLSDGRARVISYYQVSPTSYSYKYYDVPVTALNNGVNNINIEVRGNDHTIRVYHDATLSVTTPMSHWSAQKLPYAPITQSLVRFETEKSSLATWVSVLLYGVKETVNGNVVTAVPGNDLVPFGIDYPRNDANALGTQYMASHGHKGVAWADLQWLEYQPQQIAFTRTLLNAGWELGIHYNASLTSRSEADAEAFMRLQYDQLTAIFGQAPTSWCSYQNADNATHAAYAYRELGMIWRNGYSGVSYLVNIGNLQESRWPEFWSKVSAAQMVYPSFTHKTDQTVAEDYSISYSTFTSWINNYEGKSLVGFREYYYRMANQADTRIHYQTYQPGQALTFSVNCNAFPTRLLVEFPGAANAVVVMNGVSLTRNVGYTVADDNHLVIASENNAVIDIRSAVVPNAPSGLVAAPGNGQVTLTWSAPEGTAVTGYNVYRGTSSGGETLLRYVEGAITCTDQAVTNGVTYYYRVTALNAAGEGPWSDEVHATPTAPYTVPGTPLDVMANAQDGKIIVAWSPPSADGGQPIEHYVLYRGLVVDDLHPLVTLNNDLTYTDADVVGGQAYHYQVSAVNGVGEGPRSAETVSSFSAPPSAPVLTSATPGDGCALLKWDQPVSDGGAPVLGYVVYRMNAAGDDLYFINVGNVGEFTDTSLVNGHEYQYRVSAVNHLGEGPRSNAIYVTPAAVPSAPQNLMASAGSSQVSLSWEAPATSGGSAITGYRIYRGTGSGDTAYLIAVGDVRSYIDTSASIGTNYIYEMSAVNGLGESPRSNQASAAPFGVPTAPRDLGGTSGNGRVDLAWSSPASDGGSAITAYRIYRGTSSGLISLVATVESTTWTDLAVANGQQYRYQVSAVNVAGEGPLSSQVILVPATVPSAPADLAAQEGDGKVTLTWSAPSDGGTAIGQYLIYRDGMEIGTSTSPTYIDTGVTNGVSYKYQVRAHNAMGTGDYSNEVTATPTTSLAVTSPSGDVTWYKGSTYLIEWAALNGGSVRIDLILGNDVAYTMLGSTANDGQESWTVPQEISPGTGYRVRISSVSYPEDVALSVGSITLADPTIEVTSPTRTSMAIAGSQLTVSWTTVGTIPSIKVQLLKGGSLVSTLTDTTANDGTQEFTLSITLAPGNDYSVRVISTSSEASMGDSEQFTIRAPGLAVTYPAGGETIVAGSSVGIRWNGDMSLLGKVAITLWQNGKQVSTITSSTSNDGSYIWSSSPSLAAGSGYTIRVTPTAYAGFYDDSAAFTVRKPVLVVTSPSAGASYARGSAMTIAWQKDNANIGMVKIELYKNGVLSRTITTSTANDGSYSWRVPTNLATGSYQIKLTSTSSSSIYAWSGAFTIK